MAQYNGNGAFILPRALRLKNGINAETINANKELNHFDSQIQILTNSKGSVATVKVPTKKDGAHFWIKCETGSGHALYIQDADGNDVIGAPYLAAGKASYIVCDGSNWVVLFQQA